MIKLANVCKHYPQAQSESTALDGIDLEISKGEFVAIMGPSGSGKSTLLNIVGLIDAPSSGRYVFGDQELSYRSTNHLAELRKRNIAFIFQSFHLIAELNVYENVELPLRYQNVAKARRQTLVREVLELVGLDKRATQFPEQLSGGEQQRVAVARALVNDPKLIVADEPTGNLDSKNGDEVMQMLTTLNHEGATVVIATHSPAHASRAHRVVHLLDGRIVARDQTRI
ncbi:MAG TPA: ABC transporter ATP-binding protein [Gammaproteobacteria bacterium]|nr:ABC transporter ATP-binding protein [Gammaproteobacteria bacterium]